MSDIQETTFDMTNPSSTEKQTSDAVELRLVQMRGSWSVISRCCLSLIGLATTISWTGLRLSIVTGIGAGGPGAIIYGFMLVSVLQCFLGASLTGFVSSYPTEWGMHHWIAAIAPATYRDFLSFITGWFTVCGWVFTTPSTNLV